MSVHSPPLTTREPSPQLVTEHMGKSHVRVRDALATVDRSLGRIALAYGLQYCALDAIAHGFLRLERAVEWALRREERYLQSLVRKVEHDSSRQQTSDVNELAELAPEIDTITTELLLLRQVTNNFVPPDDACRSYETLMNQLEELASVLDVFIDGAMNREKDSRRSGD